MKINKEKHATLDRSTLQKLVEYSPETGEMWRIIKFDAWGNSTKIRKLITGKNNRGYRWVSFRLNGTRQTFLVHRLAFLWMLEKHPMNEIDHINGDRDDNRWVNLRECSPFENSRNQGTRIDNTSGVRGVNYNTSSKSKAKARWVARISHMGERILLGNFLTFEEAVSARKQAEIYYGYHNNHAKRKSWQK
jgi:hypothetical protein